MNSSLRRSIQNVPGLIGFISHSHATKSTTEESLIAAGKRNDTVH